MLLEAQALPPEVLKGWEAEIIETTALGDSVVRHTPTGYVEEHSVKDSSDRHEQLQERSTLAKGH